MQTAAETETVIPKVPPKEIELYEPTPKRQKTDLLPDTTTTTPYEANMGETAGKDDWFDAT